MKHEDVQIGMVVALNQNKGRFLVGDKFIVKDIDQFEELLELEVHPDNERNNGIRHYFWFAHRVDPVVQEDVWIVNNGDYIPREGDVVMFNEMKDAALRRLDPMWMLGMDRHAGKEANIVRHHDDWGWEKRFRIREDDGVYWYTAEWVVKYKRVGAVAPVEVPAPVIQFKKGDWVKVEKQHVEGKLKWLQDVQDTVGKVYKVKSFDERTKTYLLDNGFSYLVQSLTKATDEEVKAKKAKKKSLRAVIAEARKKFIPKVGTEGVCNFIMFTKANDGEIKVHDETNAPCHAALDLSYEDGGKRVGKDYRIVGVLDLLHDYADEDEGIEKKHRSTYYKFVDWMVNHSPWSIAYEKKSVKNVLENGVLLDVTKPAIVVGGACISLRFMKEFPQYLPTYQRLLKAGISRDAAYLACYSFDTTKKANEFTLGTMYGGHQVLFSGMKAGGVLSFFANGFDEGTLKLKPYAEAPNYRGIQQNLSDTKDVLGLGGTQWATFVKENVKFEEKKEGWAVTKVCKWKDVLAFGKLVEEHINKARELKANAIINEQQAAA